MAIRLSSLETQFEGDRSAESRPLGTDAEGTVPTMGPGTQLTCGQILQFLHLQHN